MTVNGCADPRTTIHKAIKSRRLTRERIDDGDAGDDGPDLLVFEDSAEVPTSHSTLDVILPAASDQENDATSVDSSSEPEASEGLGGQTTSALPDADEPAAKPTRWATYPTKLFSSALLPAFSLGDGHPRPLPPMETEADRRKRVWQNLQQARASGASRPPVDSAGPSDGGGSYGFAFRPPAGMPDWPGHSSERSIAALPERSSSRLTSGELNSQSIPPPPPVSPPPPPPETGPVKRAGSPLPRRHPSPVRSDARPAWQDSPIDRWDAHRALPPSRPPASRAADFRAADRQRSPERWERPAQWEDDRSRSRRPDDDPRRSTSVSWSAAAGSSRNAGRDSWQLPTTRYRPDARDNGPPVDDGAWRWELTQPPLSSSPPQPLPRRRRRSRSPQSVAARPSRFPAPPPPPPPAPTVRRW